MYPIASQTSSLFAAPGLFKPSPYDESSHVKLPNQTFIEFLERFNDVPNKTAFRTIDQNGVQLDEINYQHLLHRAAHLATELQARDLAGRRVILIYPNGVEFIVAFLGCLLAGVVAVPVSPPRRNRTRGFITAIYKDCQPAAFLSIGGNAEQWQTDFENDLVSGSDLSKLNGFRNHLPEWIETDQLVLPAKQQLVANSKQLISAFNVDPSALAFLQYTSGSTSVPRGVCVSFGNLMSNNELIRRGFENSNYTIGVFWLPNYHDMGLIGGILATLYTHATSTLMAPAAFLQQPLRWLHTISQQRASVSGGPDFAYALCATKANPKTCEGLDLSSWKVAFSGAESVRAATIDKFVAAFEPYGFRANAFYPCYGLAEATLIVSGGTPAATPARISVDVRKLGENVAAIVPSDAPESRALISSGRQYAGQRFCIVDPQTQIEQSENRIGEIWLTGPCVAQGYWNKPEKTAATFKAKVKGREESYLRTGDFGFISNGELYVTGRIKDLILIRGQNLYPEDIEQTAYGADRNFRHAHTAAFTIDVDSREQLIIVQELQPRAKLKDAEQAQQAIEKLRKAVARDHEVMVYAVMLVKAGAIPQTSSGKTQRFATRQQYLAGEIQPLAYWSFEEGANRIETIDDTKLTNEFTTQANNTARTKEEIQAWLIDHIAMRLRLDRKGIAGSTAFVDLGMSSIDAVEITGELADWLGRDLAPTAVYQYPTVAELANWLVKSDQLVASSTIVRGTTNSKATPVQPFVSKKKDFESLFDKNISEPIAIVGMGCRFPGGVNSAADFWKMLAEGREGVSEVPLSRWSNEEFYDPDPMAPGKVGTDRGGFVDNGTEFDASFFGISPREAIRIDPQQRILLETVWEALEQAAIKPSSLSQTRTGVYVGTINNDYALRQISSYEDIDVFNGTGSANSILANRLSYFLDLKGPSLTLDTACSSSLVTTHLACQSLRSGEIDAAVSAGVNLLLSPEISMILTKAHMLAPDGRCKAFDASANGYVRSEGCGVVVLKRLSTAIADGNPIYGLIRGTAVNHVGRSNGLSAPNGPAQEQAILDSLADASLDGSQIGYVEAHGTGTKLGDPIEMEAIKHIYCQSPRAIGPLRVGSAKTNIGHTESAAGIVGLIKAVLVLQNQQVPPHLHLQKANPILSLDDGQVIIPTQLQDVDANLEYAGVSSFGFGGTNAHAILQRTPDALQRTQTVLQGADPEENQSQLLTLSARTPAALIEASRNLADLLQQGVAPKLDLADVAWTLNAGRENFQHRLAIVSSNGQDVSERLQTYVQRSSAAGITVGLQTIDKRPKIAFLFTGQGSQYANMGQSLYNSEPEFRIAIDECAAILERRMDLSLLEVLWGTETGRIDQTQYTQPALFAIQYALLQLWKSWGVTPMAVAGHSVGEFAAAYAAGILSLEDALMLLAERASLMGKLPTGGQMAAILSDRVNIESAIQDAAATFTEASTLAIAALNAPTNIVVSGRSEQLDVLLEIARQRGYRCQKLNTSHAFHSTLMEAMLTSLQVASDHVSINPPKLPIASNLTGSIADETTFAQPDYWCQHARSAVRFADNVTALHNLGCDTFIEIGPEPILVALAGRNLPADSTHHAIVSLKRNVDAKQTMLTAVGKLFALGQDLNWSAIHASNPQRNFVSLPTYPFERETYFEGSIVVSRLRDGGKVQRQSGSTSSGLLGSKLDLPIPQIIHERLISQDQFNADQVWKIDDQRLINQAATLQTILIAAAEVSRDDNDVEDSFIAISDVRLSLPTWLASRQTKLQTIIDSDQRTACSVEMLLCEKDLETSTAKYTKLASASIINPLDSDTFNAIAHLDSNKTSKEILWSEVVANRRQLNLQFGEMSKYVESINRFSNHVTVQLKPSQELSLENLAGLLDELFAIVECLATEHFDKAFAVLPATIKSMRLAKELSSATTCSITFDDSQLDELSINLQCLDAKGQALLSIKKLELKTVPRDSLINLTRPINPTWLREFKWVEKPILDSPDVQPQRWLILNDQANHGEQIAKALSAQQHKCIVLPSVATPAQLLDQLDEAKTVDAVLHLGSLDIYSHAATENLASAKNLGWGAMLQIVQTISQEQFNCKPSLYFATMDAFELDKADKVQINVAQAPLWGLARVVANEYPDLNCQCVDLRSTDIANDDAWVQPFVRHLLSQDQEDQVAIRGESRFVARLEETHLHPQTTADNASIAADKTYLITGGLGGLGLHVTQWLINRGAKSIVLLGRSAATENSQKQLDAWNQLGLNVVAMQCDVSQRDQLATVLRRIVDDMPPLTGIYHLAGFLDDGLIRDQTIDRFERVMAAKSMSAIHLHELTIDLPLTQFVMFSSVAAIVGAPGQSNYAAANAVLDALVHHRRATGLVGTSINWGSWSSVGMAAGLQQAEQDRLTAAGVGWIDPIRGLQFLTQTLSSNSTQIAVLPMNWAKFCSRIPRDAMPAWLAAIADAQTVTMVVPEVEPELLKRLSEIDAADKFVVIESYIIQLAAKTLGLQSDVQPDGNRTLNELGFDSLTGVELCNMIGRSINKTLSPTVLFDHPTLHAISQYVADDLLELGQPRLSPVDVIDSSISSTNSVVKPIGEATVVAVSDDRLMEDVESMSEQEMEALVNAELSKLGI